MRRSAIAYPIPDAAPVTIDRLGAEELDMISRRTRSENVAAKEGGEAAGMISDTGMSDPAISGGGHQTSDVRSIIAPIKGGVHYKYPHRR